MVRKIVYGYENNGNGLVREEKSRENGTWVDSQKFIFTYNANNQVTSEHIYHIAGGSWVVVTERLYTYNVNNNIIQFVESRLENDGWLERSRVYYYYSVHKTPVAVEDVQTDKDLCYVTADRTMMWKQAGYVEVYTSLGQLLYKGYTNSVAVKQSGVYLVRRDGVTEKIVVR